MGTVFCLKIWWRYKSNILGATSIEYGLLVSLLALTIMGGAGLLGEAIQTFIFGVTEMTDALPTGEEGDAGTGNEVNG